MRQLLIYPDTSVFGGCFDEEFAEASQALFNEIEAGRFLVAVSATTLRELQGAPREVRELVTSIPRHLMLTVDPSPEIEELRDAYVAARVVSEGSLLDAEHIASASVAGADLVVSWNFKHIVHFEKIRGYHAVNLLRGYPPVAIHSPLEVIDR